MAAILSRPQWVNWSHNLRWCRWLKCFLNRQGPIVNSMAADALATQGARASSAMLLTKFTQNIWASTTQRLKLVTFLKYDRLYELKYQHLLSFSPPPSTKYSPLYMSSQKMPHKSRERRQVWIQGMTYGLHFLFHSTSCQVILDRTMPSLSQLHLPAKTTHQIIWVQGRNNVINADQCWLKYLP